MAGIAGKVQRHAPSLDPSGKSKYVSTASGLDVTTLKEGGVCNASGYGGFAGA